MSQPRWTTRMMDRCRRIADADMLDFLPLLTVILLLLSPLGIWYLQTPLVILCVVGIAHRPLLKTTPFWFILALMLGTTIYLNWESADNHKYLFSYWCLALACAFSVHRDHQRSALVVTSRLLIGLCMAFATIWKLFLSDSYCDGAFFEYTFLIDERFQQFTRMFGDVSASLLRENRELWSLLTDGHIRGIEVEKITLNGTPQVGTLAFLVTWWTVFAEGALAILFLLPDKPKISNLRNAGLLLFALSTYAVATVKGFGWILMMLGMAQTEQKQWKWRLLYLLVFLLIQAYTMPLGTLFDAFTGIFAAEDPCCGQNI